MANTYNGTASNDTMNVLDPAGRHGETATWNGGAGTDTLNFAVHNNAPGRAVFTFVQNGSSITMSGVTAGSSWTYTLNSIEKVKFNDQTIDLTAMFPSAFGDTVAPTASFSPTNNAVDVSNTANIVVTFNEAVKFGTGTITITETGTNNVIATYNTTLGMANNANVSISGTTLTINPTADLGLSTDYTVALSSGSIKDTAGNNYAGNVAANYHFTTASGPVVNGTAGNDTLVAPTIDNTTMNGLAGNDTLTGSSGDDRLNGGAGNDSLNGGAGADTMTGGTGNDIYVVDTGDMIVEAAGAAGGIDSIQSDATYSLVDTDGTGTLGSNVENLTLTGSASIDGTGNALANKITGNSGNNVLTGGAGIDTLNGGAGNDTYHVNLKSTMVGLVKVASLQDAVAEGAAAGTDTIVIAAPATAITLTVASAITLGANIENLDASLTGLTKLTLVGNGLDNILTGNDAANAINGGLGNDTLLAVQVLIS
ncbi:MAG: hypothetical protein HOP21_02245 [Methylotenera sp.]|nr:hypothetical protein [Methylotenera sp.]